MVKGLQEERRRKENARKRALPGAVDRNHRTESLVAEVRKERSQKTRRRLRSKCS